MNAPPTDCEFFDAAKEAFSFMPALVSTEKRSTFYSASFASRMLRLSVSYDLRDNAVDCSIQELRDASTRALIPLPTHCSLHGFVVAKRGYRGAFSEFLPSNKCDPPWKIEFAKFGLAVRHFFVIEATA